LLSILFLDGEKLPSLIFDCGDKGRLRLVPGHKLFSLCFRQHLVILEGFLLLFLSLLRALLDYLNLGDEMIKSVELPIIPLLFPLSLYLPEELRLLKPVTFSLLAIFLSFLKSLLTGSLLLSVLQ